MASTLLFDLDGTLVDPARGILSAFRHALTTLGHTAPAPEELHWVIGPPLRRSFATLLGESGEVERAVGLYREAYGAGGIFDATPYDGIHDALDLLQRQGHRLLVCTAKPEPFARQVIAHFDFEPLFAKVYGAALDARFDDKADLIAHMIGEEGFTANEAVMIGDRDNDTRAATRNAMRSVGVLWGYGSREELTGTGATVLCDSPRALPATLAALA